MDVLKSLDWSPLFISLKTGFISTVIIFFIGTAAAYFVMRLKKGAKWLIDSLFTVPLVMPPTAAGYLLLLLFSLRRPIGAALYESFDFTLIQTQAGCIVAAAVIAFPLMYRNARAAFEQTDENIIFAARTLGMSELKILCRVIIPTAAPGLFSGTILAFARAMGEYGATSMIAGNILGKTRTMAVAVASSAAGGDFHTAGIWVAVIIVISFVIVFAANLITGYGMKGFNSWHT